MRSELRLLLLAILTLMGCAAPADDEGDDVVVDADLGAALSRGDAPLADAIFIPSSRVEVGTWVVYSVGAPGARSTELLFVNHNEDAASIAVTFDVASGKLSVLAAPDDGSGPALAEALLADIAAYETEAPAAAVAGSVTTQNLGRLTAEGAEQLLARAAAKLGLSKPQLLGAIDDYTRSGYLKLNAFLREGARPEGWAPDEVARTRTRARTLVHAIRALPPVEAQTHRWVQVGFDGYGRFERASFDALLAQLESGIYRDRAFLSTTRRTKQVVGSFSSFRFDIKGRTGRDVGPYSNLPSEEEILFVPGTRFDVVSIRGEWIVPRMNVANPSPEGWFELVTAASKYFPGVTLETVRANRAAGKIPTVIVTLEERATVR